ncbi:RNA-directed DNA polymerase, eukaryota, reverse transcriptase zinc-binding domain protein [Tanacetum coccineum]
MNRKPNTGSVEKEGLGIKEEEVRDEQVVSQTVRNEDKANEERDDSVCKESINNEKNECGESNGNNVYDQNIKNAGEGKESNSVYKDRSDVDDEKTNYVGHVEVTKSVDEINKASYTVIEKGVWIVNNKPMVVQKWDIDVDINKLKPDKLPIWVKGLSALASRLEKPVVIDNVTTMMCNQGIRRLGYARVLIKVEVKTCLFESIDIQYYDKDDKMSISKRVKNKGEQERKDFDVVRNRRNNVGKNQNKENHFNNNDRNYKYPNKNNKGVMYRVVNTKQNQADSRRVNKEGMERTMNITNVSPKSVWNVQSDILSAINRTANKFVVLQEEEVAEKEKDSKTKWMERIDEFVATKQDPPLSVTEMINEKEIELDENDVFINKFANAKFMSENEVRGKEWHSLQLMDCKVAAWNNRGLGKVTKKNEVKSLIRNEKLCVCAILKSHMKKDRKEKVCNRIFGNWQWQHKLGMSQRGCKIIVGWNQELVHCHLMQSDRQTMCYMVEFLKSDTKFFCTFIYADNHGRGRKNLLKDLCMYKRMIGNNEWIIMGDFNITLNTSEHSEGMSYASQDMKELANYITKKEEFGDIVKNRWEKSVHGYAMFQLVYKLKSLKPQLNKLKWKNGNIFNRVEELKGKLTDIQGKIDKDPLNKMLRETEVKLLNEYITAAQGEEKLLYPKAKVDWLRDGDRNSSYFHKVLKGKLNRSKIHTVMAANIEDSDAYLFNKIDANDAECMSKDVTEEEIRRVVVDIDDSKAPGPDEFFRTEKLLGEVNATLITLVPKIHTPLKAYDTMSWRERIGYFKGGRGLRQGDPITSYLFTLVMEVLNLFLKDEIAKERNFKYHFGCKKLKITHLCFADDMLMLCHGDPTSINTIKRALEKKKSTIASVLSSMQVYWGYVFLLPTTVVLEIKTLFKGFLWCNGEFTRGKAKVAWKDVCKPKDKESLWVKWINTVKLKGKSVWDTQSYGSDSWCWKTILSLRQLVNDHVKSKIDNGKTISAWYDRWNEDQALINTISKSDVCQAGFKSEQIRWKWPDDWLRKHALFLEDSCTKSKGNIRQSCVGY